MSPRQSHLSGRLLIGLSAVWILIALGTSQGIVSWLERDMDRTLQARAQVMAALTWRTADNNIELASHRIPSLEADGEREYFQLWSGDGRRLERSVSLTDGKRLRSDPNSPGETDASHLNSNDLQRDVVPSAEPRFRDVILPDGRRGRQVQLDFLPALVTHPLQDAATAHNLTPSTLEISQRHRLAVLVLAQSRQRLDARQRSVLLTALLVALVMLAGTYMLMRWSIFRALHPWREITRQLPRLGANNWAPLHIPDLPAELQPMVDQFNALLTRLEQAFARERRLSSNIAHELRTPIAELKSLAEVGTRWPEKQDMVAQFFEDVQDISAQMEKTVTHLLALARYESGLEIVRREAVDLGALLTAAWQPQAREASRKSIATTFQVHADARVRSDPDKLELMLGNLLNNAVTYSPPGSTICCETQHDGHHWTISIINPAEHLQQDDVPHLFDRFWRKDPSRTDTRHNGLGLSLVQAFAELLGIELTAQLDADGRLHMQLHFDPRSPNGTHGAPTAARHRVSAETSR